MRWALRLLAALVALVVMVPLVAVLALETGPGQELARRAAAAAGIRIAAIEGSPLRATTLRGVSLADADGTWLAIERVELAWSPLSLLARRVEIDTLRLVGLALTRLPVSEAEEGPASAPSLPVDLTVRDFALEGARIAAAVAGMNVTLDGTAQAALRRDLTGTAELDLRDSTGGHYRATLRRDADVAIRLDIAEPANGLIARLAGLPELGRLAAQATAEGTAERAETRFALTFDGGVSATAEGVLALRGDATDLGVHLDVAGAAVGAVLPEGYRFARLILDGRLAGDLGSALRVSAEAQAEGVALPDHLPLPRLDAAPVTLRLAATRDADGTIAIGQAAVAHPLLALTATGRIDGDTTLTIHSRLPSLAPFATAAGIEADGALVLAARIAHGDAATALDADLRFADAALPAPLDLLLGDAPTVAARARLVAGTVTIERLTVAGLAATLDLAGSAGETLDLAGTLALPALTALAAPLAGEARLDLALRGTAADPDATLRLDAPHLAVEGVGAGRLALTAEASRLVSAPRVAVQGSGDLGGREIAIAGDAEPQPDGAIAVPRIELRYGAAHIAGQGRVLADGRPDFAGTAAVPRLAELLPGIAGAIEARLALAPDATGGVGATVEARAQGIAAEGIAIAEATLSGTAADALRAPALDLRLAARGLAAGGASGALDLAATGPPEALGLSARFAGPELTASLTAEARLPERIALSAFEVSARGETIRLAAPTTLRLGETIELAPLALALRGGRIEARGRLSPTLDLTLAASRLPLALAALAAPGLAPAGTLDLEATLRGAPAAPEGNARLAVRGARLPDGPGALLPPADLDATLALAGGRADVRAQLRAGTVARLDLTAQAPLDGGPIRARLDGPIDLALTDPFLTPAGRRARGRLVVALSAEGALPEPALAGEVRLADASIDDAVLGLRLAGIGGRFVARGDAIAIEGLTARAGDGTLALGGTLRPLAPGLPLDLTLAAREATLALADRATVRLSADLRLAGDTGALAATGRIDVARAEILLPERLPADVVDLPVRVAGEAPPAPPPAADSPIALDIAVEAPRAVFVRGRGVDAELGGSVRLGGTAAAPDLTGAFGLRRGEISILAQRIAFRRGALDFDGAAGIDPALDFEAATTAGDITAIVRVGGTATAPRITLGSEPEVPQDEVLARLLFGRSQATLTPVQLLQLAQAAAELTGVGPSGPGILDRVRRGLGLDRLTVGTDQATGGPTVEAGRYLADGVYLGARRTADGSTRATVQIEVLPNVRAEADVGGEGEGRVGLSWGIDY
jgi:translocation and assembly module TamB